MLLQKLLKELIGLPMQTCKHGKGQVISPPKDFGGASQTGVYTTLKISHESWWKTPANKLAVSS